ncbi:tape-measure protein [Streptomyces sp. NPDC003027]
MSALALNPLAGSGPGFSALTGGARQAAESVQRVLSAVRRAASGVDALDRGARTAAPSVRTFGQNAASANAAVGKLSGPGPANGIRKFGSATAKARRTAGKLGTGVGGILAVLLPLLPVTDVITKLMGTFGTVMTVAAVAMTAVNVAMRANPIGFLVGILVPVAAYLIELAVNSQTGQKFLKQAFQAALKTFQAIWKFLSPLMKVLGKAVATYAKAYLTLFKAALKGVGAMINGIKRIGTAVTAASQALRGIASRTLGGIKGAVKPVLSFITDKIPGFFRTAKDAVSRALRGIGDLVKGALSAVVGVVKGPVNGIIAFANWIIDGLNELSVSIPLTDKKFGVDIDKIPMLAEGGVVFPGAADAPRIDPLTVLENRRVPALTEPSRPPHRIRDFHEEPGAGPRSTAEDLLFLAAAHR